MDNSPETVTLAQHMWSEEWTAPVEAEVSTDEAYQAEPITSETAETVAVGLWWDMDNSPETVTLAQHMWSEEWTAPVEAQVSTDEAYQAEPITVGDSRDRSGWSVVGHGQLARN